jgi:hypothetical protein
MNYTKPHDEGHEDSPQDWLAGALVFAQTLSLVIPDGEGILVKAKGDAVDYFGPKEGLLIVANIGSQMQIIPLGNVIDDTSGFEEGMWITIGEQQDENTETDGE